MRSYEEYKQILHLWEQGHNKVQIAKLTGIPRSTVTECIKKYHSVDGLDQSLNEKIDDIDYEEAQNVLTLWESGKSKVEIIATTKLSKYAVDIYIDRFRSLAGLIEAQANPQRAETNKSTRRRKFIPKDRKYTDDELRDAVKTSHSLRQALSCLGLSPAGGNYKTIKQRIEELGLDTSHFRGKGWAKDHRNPYHTKRPLDEVLVKNSDYLVTSSLKKTFAQ